MEKKNYKILDSVGKSKSNDFDRFLIGLGIKHVGYKIAKILSQKFKNIDNLKNASSESLLEIPEVGVKIAHSIKEYFSKEENLQEIQDLKTLGLSFNQREINKNFTNNFFTNKKLFSQGFWKNIPEIKLKI